MLRRLRGKAAHATARRGRVLLSHASRQPMRNRRQASSAPGSRDATQPPPAMPRQPKSSWERPPWLTHAEPRAVLQGYSAIIEFLHLKAKCPPSVLVSGVIAAERPFRRVEPVSSPFAAGSLESHIFTAATLESVNLEVIEAALVGPSSQAILSAAQRVISSDASSPALRRFWFALECYSGKPLDLPGAAPSLPVEPLLPPDLFYTLSDGRVSQRHRIDNNALADARLRFCVFVRRTEKLCALSEFRVLEDVRDLAGWLDPQQLERAGLHLSRQEASASLRIEHEDPTPDRVLSFVHALQQSESQARQPMTLASLTWVQRMVLAGDFDAAWESQGRRPLRTVQNWVGRTVADTAIVDLVPPPPGDLPDLVGGLVDGINRCANPRAATADAGTGALDPVVAAAAFAFGFVWLHPLADGNGRVHRFLIHWMLRRRQSIPQWLPVPVSIRLLASRARYFDQALKDCHAGLESVVDHVLLEDAELVVTTPKPARFWRSVDATPFVEFLYEMVRATVAEDLPREFAWLREHDAALTRLLRALVEVPAGLTRAQDPLHEALEFAHVASRVPVRALLRWRWSARLVRLAYCRHLTRDDFEILRVAFLGKWPA